MIGGELQVGRRHSARERYFLDDPEALEYGDFDNVNCECQNDGTDERPPDYRERQRRHRDATIRQC